MAPKTQNRKRVLATYTSGDGHRVLTVLVILDVTGDLKKTQNQAKKWS